jgi:CheY-like chemotaxis protein
MSEFERKRILIVEDEAIVADMLQMMLEELEVLVVGPASTIAEALDLAEAEPLDAAILDVNLRGHKVDPVAETLRRRRVPLLFATGYGEGAAETARGSPIIAKPYTKERLAAALAACLSQSG